ncbi:phosphodiester glycosidase family protein [Fluviispira multicolorata]|uniref:Phosphodiester glycosidase domain-containing protein n=1 Tax=Fluviispira multicolorata TaxID=2654512 RepID=A0A833JDN1_9BACT|nr:phosphodiester glycosidase family protein [Fluviispira multicolorata]KAB8031963.1 hypothetical protein GCL57_04770 [Fluviispira multicolorata]
MNLNYKSCIVFWFLLVIINISCRNIEKEKIFINRDLTYVKSVDSLNRKVFVDNKNGFIIVQGINKQNELENNKEEVIFQFEEGYEIYINNTLMANNLIKISDILSVYNNNVPTDISIIIKKNFESFEVKRFLLTFSKLPIFEIQKNSIQNHPIINDNILTFTDGLSTENLQAKIKMNTRGKGSLKNPKQSFALYGDNDLSKIFKEKFNVYSKSNEYSLYSSYLDSSMIREKFGHDLFNRQIAGNSIHENINMSYIDVFIEGEYYGVYALMNTVNPSDLVFKNDSENLFNMFEMNNQNVYSIKKNNEDVLRDALLGKKGDLFSVSKLHKNGAGLASFANRNVICNPNFIQFFDKNYSQAYLSTILATQALDNITNNVHLAVYPALSKNSIWNTNELFSQDFKIYYIPWDLDMSLGAVGWMKDGAFDIDYSNYKEIYNNKAINTKLTYNVSIENQASLLTCYTRTNSEHILFRNNFNKYWLENKRTSENHFNNIRLKNHLNNLFTHLEENGAYAREFKRWSSRSGSKFTTYDLNKMMNWIDNRLEYIEKNFLNIETKQLIKYKKLFGIKDHSNVNVIDFNPSQVQLAIETKNFTSGSSSNSNDKNIFNNGALTILDLLKQDDKNIAGITGGFFEYWHNGNFVHYQDNNLNKEDINNHFSIFNTKMISTCSETNEYPKDGVVTLPIGILKINDKWYSSEDNFTDVVGWNDKGEYKIDRVKVIWDVLFADGTSILNGFNNLGSSYIMSSPKINVFRSDTILQSGSTDYLEKNIEPKRRSHNVVIYFDTFSERTRTPEGGLEVIVENDIITDINDNGNNFIPKNGFVVSVSRNYIENELIKLDFRRLKVGERLKSDFKFYNERNEIAHTFNDMTFIRGKVQALVINNKSAIVHTFGHPRNPFVDSNRTVRNLVQYLDVDFFGKKHPRTALCFRKGKLNDDGSLNEAEKNWALVLVDGRKRTSFGMTLVELSQYLVNKLNCDDAINLDGGSSANMIADGLKMNVSGSWRGFCEGVPRPVSDVIVLKEKRSN